MEESGVATTWSEAINKAVRIENARKKYLMASRGQASSDFAGSSVPKSTASSKGMVPSTTVSLRPEDSVSQTHTLLTQVADSLRALQLQLGPQQGGRSGPPNNPPRPPPRCWNCGQEGHISLRCSLPPQGQNHHQGPSQRNGNGRQ